MASGQPAISILKRYFTTAPIIFPLIGLFHIFLFCYEGITWFDPHVGLMYWFRPIILLVYTVSWIGACFLRKKYATTYLIVTILTVSFYYLCPSTINNLDGQGFFQELFYQVVLLHRALGDVLLDPLPANILFSFIILLYYRRMLPQSQRFINNLKTPGSTKAG